MKQRGGRCRARPSPSVRPWASSIGARRLTASARSISSTENELSRPLPGSPALATSTSTSPASASSRAGRVGHRRGRPRSRGRRPPPRAARAPPRAARSASASRRARPAPRAIAWPRPPVAPVSSTRAPSELHANTATVAVKRVQEVAAADRADLARGEEARGGRARQGVGDRLGVVVGAAEHAAPAAVAREHAARPPACGRPARSCGSTSASRRSRSALSASRACRRTTWPGCDVGGDRDLPGLGVGADEAAHEEVALQVVGLVGVDDDPDQQPALDEPQVLGRQLLDRLAQLLQRRACRPARRSRGPRRR